MIGLEFVKDPETREPDESLRDSVVNYAFERGLLLLGCGKSVIRISPPLCIRREELELGFEILDEAIETARVHAGPLTA